MLSHTEKKFAAKFIRENIEHILLDYLAQSDLHGYALIQQILKDHSIYLGPSTVYPALSKLEEQGLIQSNWDLTKPRVRKIFTITTQGKAEHQREETIINQIFLTQKGLALKPK